MPRINSRTILEATKQSRLLPLLLRANSGSLPSALRELRWIKAELPQSQWEHACRQRFQLVPLQYILGTQPFAHGLELLCRPEVLIPRNDTESWCVELAEVLERRPAPLRLLDVCSGSGCISLSMASSQAKFSDIVGIDVSDPAIRLAKDNLAKNRDLVRCPVRYVKGDILRDRAADILGESQWDILVANPPYITQFETYEKSVRLYEPELALLGDLEFYDALAQMAGDTKVGAIVFELGNRRQATHTAAKMTELCPGEWEFGVRNDAGGIRNVIGWTSQFTELSGLCHELL